ncbi:MAG: hypothetical protein RDU20_16370 [Desulfomonilaceae bacterium]|nr:hypothetical protein [Desulfomonilaceae bacterium]
MRPGVSFELPAKIAAVVSTVVVSKYRAAAIRTIAPAGSYSVRLIPVLATVLAAMIISGGGPVRAQTGAQSPQLKGLSAQEASRFKQIITGVIQNPNYLTPAVHDEFWRTLAKTRATPAQVRSVRESMTGMLTVYYPMFWQDALVSLRNRRPYKSPQRQQYENKLLSQRIVTSTMISANDSLMANIASGKPIVRQGQSIVLNEQMIQASLQSVQEAARRVDRLFTPGQR